MVEFDDAVSNTNTLFIAYALRRKRKKKLFKSRIVLRTAFYSKYGRLLFCVRWRGEGDLFSPLLLFFTLLPSHTAVCGVFYVTMFVPSSTSFFFCSFFEGRPPAAVLTGKLKTGPALKRAEEPRPKYRHRLTWSLFEYHTCTRRLFFSARLDAQ